jgi:hypothetical protein
MMLCGWALYSPHLVRSEGLALSPQFNLCAHLVAAFLEFHAQVAGAMSTGKLFEFFESELFNDAAGFSVLRVRSAHEKECSDAASASTITLDAVMQPHIDRVKVESVRIETRADDS